MKKRPDDNDSFTPEQRLLVALNDLARKVGQPAVWASTPPIERKSIFRKMLRR